MAEKISSRIDEKTVAPVNNPDVGDGTIQTLTNDEYHLASLGYKQEFKRTYGLFETWAATLTTMNVVSGIPSLFGFAMYTGGPKAAVANWIMVGGFSSIVSLSLAEIAAALPTAGGIYYWSYRLGGEKYGPFLSWNAAVWNWAGWITVVPGVQQGATLFLRSILQIQYPDLEVANKGWFQWLLTSLGLIFAMVPNIWSPKLLQWYFRFAIFSFFALLLMYWIWFPVRASSAGHHFNTSDGIFKLFYNGINLGDEKQASDAYCWIINILYGAWIFYGYDASSHLSEETVQASSVVAKGIWISTWSGWLMSIPTIILVFFCMQDFEGIVSAAYANNFAEYLVQLVGKNGAIAILALLWIDSTCATASCIMSASRVTYAISRDHLLPFSRLFRKLSSRKLPVNAVILVYVLSVIITTAVIGSSVAFSAITATATIATNASYLFPIVARHTVARNTFVPAKWNLGRYSAPLGAITTIWISFLFVILLLPQLYPVTAETLNYAPICIGIITIMSLAGWFMPKYGGRYWFKGPIKTITDHELQNVQVEGGLSSSEEDAAAKNLSYGRRRSVDA